jgi:MscS family membrane protein
MINSIWQYTYLDNTVGQYIICFAIILIVNIIIKLFDAISAKAIKRSAGEVTKSIFKALRIPLIIFIYGIGLFIIVDIVLTFSRTEVYKFLSAGVKGLFVLAVVYFLFKLIDILVQYLTPLVQRTESKLDDLVLPLISKTLKIFIITIAVISIINSLGYSITPLLASLGIGGLAVALAGQEMLKNLFGSVMILADRPFQAGDRVQIEGHDGAIEAIGFRSTKIRTLDGTLVIIPNSKVAESIINNVQKRPTIKNMYTIGVTYDTSYEKLTKALEILRNIFKNHSSTENYWVYFKEYGDFSLNILVIHWCKYLKYQEFLEATEEINLKIKKEFEKEAIDFAFPTQTVYMKKE